MKVPLFVTGSAAVLAAWLSMTFMQSVPVKTYPQLGRGSVPLGIAPPAQASAAGSNAPVKKTPPTALARTSSVDESIAH